MPALPPYIPQRDSDLANWSLNFATLITAAPATYGLLATDATTIDTADTAWQSAYSAAINPSTRTPQSVSDKNTAKVNLLQTLRPYAQQISLNAGVASSDKIAVGVNPRTSTPTPVTTPTTHPVLTIVSAPPLQHIIRYRDETASPSVKSKPYGVASVQLFASASITPITDQGELMFVNNYTKSPALVSWMSADKGKTAYMAARWVTRTGLVGPWSPIVAYTIAG